MDIEIPWLVFRQDILIGITKLYGINSDCSQIVNIKFVYIYNFFNKKLILCPLYPFLRSLLSNAPCVWYFNPVQGTEDNKGATYVNRYLLEFEMIAFINFPIWSLQDPTILFSVFLWLDLQFNFTWRLGQPKFGTASTLYFTRKYIILYKHYWFKKFLKTVLINYD